MPQYFHDYMHCNQEQCAKKDQCYRYWLGQNAGGTATFYHPEKPVTDGCEFFINKEYFD